MRPAVTDIWKKGYTRAHTQSYPTMTCVKHNANGSLTSESEKFLIVDEKLAQSTAQLIKTAKWRRTEHREQVNIQGWTRIKLV